MNLSKLALSTVVTLILVGCGPAGDSNLVSIQNKGSDTMLQAAQAWAEAYADASVEVSGGGSGVGVSALINGTVDIANCSREMQPDEVARAKERHGKEPEKFVVGYDAIAIYVHKNSPLQEITMDQLKGIYADEGDITTWSRLGASSDECSSDTIERASRQNNSGTYEFFKEAVIGKKGKYKLGSVDLSGSRDLVALVGSTGCAIGYSGMGYKTDEVNFVAVKKSDSAPAVLPSVEAVHSGEYPISRPLYMYTLGEPTGEIKKFLDWVRSDAGQAELERQGYVPLPVDQRMN